jgi:hypothetical protein
MDARNSPVGEVLTRATSSGRPEATTRPPPRAALGPQIDDPVGAFDDVEIVLDDDNRVALLDELAEHLEQPPDVLEMQACGRLIENVERLARASPRQFRDSLTRCASPPDSVVADWPSLM